MGMKEFRIQLKDAQTGEAIITAGGKVYVAAAGDAQKATLYDKNGAALANPVTPTRGGISFFVADTVATVDLYGMAPGGQFFTRAGVPASGPNEIAINTGDRNQCFVIPFSINDTTAAAETNTGFSIPAAAALLPTPLVFVSTLDSGMTIDFGTLSSASGDADAFIDGVALTTAGLAKATLLNSGVTMGAKFYVQDSANAGDKAPEIDISQAGKVLTYTLSGSTDTAEGFIIQPYLLAA